MLPACLDDYITEDNPVRVVEAFIDELDLCALGFERIQPAATGRPAYHPATLLKIYLYGYLNRIQSSRRLEREAGRNIARFIVICGQLGLFAHAVAAIDGAKFKAVNSRDRNFTRGKLKRGLEQMAASVERYLGSLEAADLQEGGLAEAKASRLRDKIAAMKAKLAELKQLETLVLEAPDQQISLTDPDARAMATSMRGAGVVGYNVQAAVDTEHHLIVAHDVTNIVTDRTLLSPIARMAKDAMAAEKIDVLADRGYFSGDEVLACDAIGATPYVPKPLTSNAKAAGRFGKDDFVYLADQNAYRCPAGETLSYRYTRIEEGRTLHSYWTNRCGTCALQAKCTTSKERRMNRWEHEGVIEAMQKRLDAGNAMTVRRRTVEHTFGTIKAWMGYTHFLTKGLDRVKAEMSLCVLAYNIKRMISIMGVQPLIAAVRG